MKNLGFIGMGNMAKALCSGFIKAEKIEAKNVYAYAPHFDKLENNAKEIGFNPVESLSTLVETCVLKYNPSK